MWAYVHPGILTGPARGAHGSQCLVAARCKTRLGPSICAPAATPVATYRDAHAISTRVQMPSVQGCRCHQYKGADAISTRVQMLQQAICWKARHRSPPTPSEGMPAVASWLEMTAMCAARNPCHGHSLLTFIQKIRKFRGKDPGRGHASQLCGDSRPLTVRKSRPAAGAPQLVSP